MDILQNSSQPLSSSQRSPHSRSALSPPLYSGPYDGEEDSLPSKQPSGGKQSRKSDRHHDPDSVDKSSSKKPRHRHSPVQLAALNELFERNEHPSLEERSELAERLGMETKTVNAWFQNKRASTKKRNKTTPAEQPSSAAADSLPAEKLSKPPLPSSLPSIANLLNSPVPASQLPPHSSHPRSHTSSARKAKQKDLHLNDHILADPLISTNQSQSNTQEAALESSFFAGPSDVFSVQDCFILSHNRGPDSENGAAFPLHNPDSDRGLPDADSRFVSENDGVPSRRGRNEAARTRTSPEQAEELRHAYALNAHPTREERQVLADKIGMRLQSVTNWFQNQRSQAKKQREEFSTQDVTMHPRPPHSAGSGEDSLTLRQPQPLPPRSQHPSLMIPELDSHPRLLKLSPAGVDDYRDAVTPRSRMSLPPSLSSRSFSPRTRRSVLPYARDPRDLHLDEGTRLEDGLSRPRRSRPEPHQLDALKKLLHLTSTPSIEERSALALEIGMDIGRVTNWFRNIRQTARKRAKRPGGSAGSSNPEHDASSGSSVYDDDDAMDLVYEELLDQDMDDRSEEDYQEAVTPFTDVSSSPPPKKRLRPPLPVHEGTDAMDVDFIEPSAFQEFQKVVGMTPISGPTDYALEDGGNAVTYSGVKLEDALLLLSFHQHVVH